MKHDTVPPIAELISAYCAAYPQEYANLAPLIKQLNSKGNLFSRQTLPGHITASGIVARGGKLLMIFHPYLQHWLQPGGHIEENEMPWQAAIREVEEETGLKTRLHSWHEGNFAPLDIDIHTIAENPKKAEAQHFHYDFRYVLTLTGETAAEHGEHRQEWRAFARITEPNLKRVLSKLESAAPF